MLCYVMLCLWFWLIRWQPQAGIMVAFDGLVLSRCAVQIVYQRWNQKPVEIKVRLMIMTFFYTANAIPILHRSYWTLAAWRRCTHGSQLITLITFIHIVTGQPLTTNDKSACWNSIVSESWTRTCQRHDVARYIECIKIGHKSNLVTQQINRSNCSWMLLTHCHCKQYFNWLFSFDLLDSIISDMHNKWKQQVHSRGHPFYFETFLHNVLHDCIRHCYWRESNATSICHQRIARHRQRYSSSICLVWNIRVQQYR